MGDTVGGALRRGSDRIVAGVCSGLGDYFQLDHTLVRVAFSILTVATAGSAIILYLILWFLMEPSGITTTTPRTIGDRLRQMNDEVRREFRGGFFGPHAASTTPGTPPEATPPGTSSPPPMPGSRWGGRHAGGRPSGLWFGIILIGLGAYFLLANLGYLNAFRWDIFWPVVLIAIGLLVLFRRAR